MPRHPAYMVTGLAIIIPLLLLNVPGGTGVGAPHGLPAGGTSLVYPTSVRHVVVVFLENQESSVVLQQGPYERYLAHQYAYAAQFYSVEHYSLPNYLAATSGIATNVFAPRSVANVGSLATAANLSWAAYMEGMRGPCNTTSSGLYTIYHDPFVMYEDVLSPASYCDAHVLPGTAWAGALQSGNLPSYAFVGPNLADDAHDTGVAAADTWLKGWLDPLVNSSVMAHTVVFVVYDEGPVNDTTGRNGTPGGGHVYMVAVGPSVRPGFSSSVQYNDFDLLTTTEWLLDLGRTGQNDSRVADPVMTDLFVPTGGNSTAGK